MSNALMAKFEVSGNLVELDAATVKNYLTNGDAKPTDQEVAMFIKLCQHQGLNPFLREAYLIKYSEKSPAQTVVGKDAFTRRAAELEDCKGWKAGVCCMNKKTGEYVEREGTVVLPTEELVGGWCEVKLARWEDTFKQTALLKEYDQNNSTWRKMPATMIRKVAIVQALREAFPRQFQGMYDQSEMGVKNDLPEHEIPQDDAERPIDKAKLKALSALIGKDEKRINTAKAILSLYKYTSCADVKNKDYEAIMRNLEDSFKPLNDNVIEAEFSEAVDAMPEQEEIFFDETGMPEVVGE